MHKIERGVRMKNKKVVVLGGGNGLSTLLRGLKQFPVDITAIVSVCDDGRSTGKIRKEFNLPALGDLRRDLIALSETEPLFEKMFNYRFKTSGELDGHTVGNIILVAMTEMTGSVSEAVEVLGKVFNLKGQVFPLTEESNNTLMAEMADGTIVEGEHNITDDHRAIKRVFYKEEPKITPQSLKAIKEADLIILSMGSLYTSIIPNLLSQEMITAIDQSQAKIMYICNMMTQPGETDHYTASDHVKVLNRYLGTHKIDVVLANNGTIAKSLLEKYKVEEQKDPVKVDHEQLKTLSLKLIEDNFVTIEDNMIRHDTIRLALQIFSYLLS